MLSWFLTEGLGHLLSNWPSPGQGISHNADGQGGLVQPPLAIGPDSRRGSRKRPVDAPRRDLAIAHIGFGPRSIFDLVRSGQRSNFREKWHFLALHAHSGVSMCRSDLKPSTACSSFNSEQDRVFYCIPLQYLAYVVLLSRTASPSPAVIAVTVKIQIGRMTMIGHGDVEKVVWRRF